jgi:hypothetical protein
MGPRVLINGIWYKAALARGMSPVQVANFLGRDEHEVGEKAREFE